MPRTTTHACTYTTMTQDEARHLEAWLRLSNEVGGVCEPDPYLEKLGELTMNVDTIEEKIWLFQVAFEGSSSRASTRSPRQRRARSWPRFVAA